MKGKRVFKKLSAMILCMVMFLTLLPTGFAESKSDFTIAAPTLLGLEKQGQSLKLTWAGVPGVSYYSVHRKVNGGSWWTVAQVAGTSYTDTNIVGNTKYTYTVRCVDQNGKRLSWYDEVGLSYNMTWPNATPHVTGTMHTNAITINWDAVSSTGRYSVHRKVNGGSWNTIAKVNATSYTDTAISVGQTYTYTVRCLDGSDNYASWYESGISFTPVSGSWSLGTPHLTGANYNANGTITVTWNAVSGASRYSVHRKVNGGGWVTVAQVNGTSYTDPNVNKGNTYTYTVRCIDNNGQYLSWYEAGLTVNTDAAAWDKTPPQLRSVTNTGSGVMIKWEPVPGVSKYSVHRKENGGSWSTIGIATTNEFLDKTASSGKYYSYTVRCLNDANQYISNYNSIKSISFYPCANPDFKIAQSNGGITITWNAVAGAAKYSVHRKVNGGSWYTIATVNGTSYTDKQVTPGVTYTYTVRCLHADGTYASWYNDGKTLVYNGVVKSVELENGQYCVIVKWKPITGAAKYRVYRKANAGDVWKGVGDTPNASTTSFEDHKVVSNTDYIYTVRGVDSSGNLIGDYDTVGKSIRYYDPPEILDVTQENGGIMVTWNKIVGINNYQIYRRNKGVGEYKLVGSTQDLYFLDKNVTMDVAYEYGVRCVSNDGTQVVSGMNVKALDAWLETPILDSAQLNQNVVEFKFKSVDGAAFYRIKRRTANTGWQDITTAATDPAAIPGTEYMTYKDLTAVSGTTYWYSVACVDSAHKVVSNFDQNGVQLLFYEVPYILTIENEYSGVTITWDVVDNTGVYWIYRRVGDNGWENIGTSEMNTVKYTDTTAQTGMNYWYAVCSMDVGNAQLSDFEKTGKQIVFYQAPSMISVRNVEAGVEVKWSDVSGISNYLVYRRPIDGAWERLSPIATSTTFIDPDASLNSGSSYVYTIRCADGGGNKVSGYDPNGLGVKYIKAPALVSATAAADGITVQWQNVEGAEGYAIYRRVPGGEWEQIGTAGKSDVTFKDTNNLIHEQIYEYTVRGVSGSEMSGYVWAGISVQAQ